MLRSTYRRLGKGLVIVEAIAGKIAPVTFSAITAAAKCGPITALVAGSGSKALAASIAATVGVQSVIAIEDAAYDTGLAENWAPLLVDQIKAGQFTHVIAGSSGFGRNVLPRAAAKLDVMPITDVVGIESEDTFVRPIYAGNALTTVKSKDSVKLLLVRGTAFDRAAATGGSGTIVEGKSSALTTASKWIEDIVAKSDKPDLSTSRVIVSGGRGLKNGDNFKLLNELAAPMKGAIGATRAVVDAGYVPYDMQIGQTGKVVAPQVYFAIGLSGAIQHIAGMKDSKTIVAINTDAEAPIFSFADYGLVQDLFKAVPELTSMIGK